MIVLLEILGVWVLLGVLAIAALNGAKLLVSRRGS